MSTRFYRKVGITIVASYCRSEMEIFSLWGYKVNWAAVVIMQDFLECVWLGVYILDDKGNVIVYPKKKKKREMSSKHQLLCALEEFSY